MKNKEKRLLPVVFLLCLSLLCILTGCAKVKEAKENVTMPQPVVVERGETVEAETEPESVESTLADTENQIIESTGIPERTPVKVKGIYVSAYVAGTPSMVDNLLEQMDQTEANAMVIDLKEDFGHVVCEMDSPLVTEVGSVKVYIPNIAELMQKLEDHDVYTIARIPAFRDAWLGDAKPQWCVTNSDGSVFRDRDGNAWVNPYKQEAWDYLVEIGIEAKKLGFDEVQFDYVRFCTERGMQDAVFDEADVQGRSRTDVIIDFMEYAYEKLSAEGLFVSADVFGAIINSGVDADSVGQIYGEMAKHLDYISPMIYPSHYSDGNYGIDHPDLHPYDTICAALKESQKELYFAGESGGHIAQVRPWLQDFTATWLTHHIPYGGEQVRQQIQATYDCGYDEWLLWDASCKYEWDGLLTPQAAQEEAGRIESSRAQQPPTTFAPEEKSTEAVEAKVTVATEPTELGPPPETGVPLPGNTP